jgi:hypothetical protein
VLLAYRRAPGRAYQPALFENLEGASDLASRLRTILCPAPGLEQEVYFNTRNFAR